MEVLLKDRGTKGGEGRSLPRRGQRPDHSPLNLFVLFVDLKRSSLRLER